jgi:hypothetical protein
MQEKGDSPSSVQALAPFLVTPVRQPLELEQSEPPVVPLGPASFGQPTQKPQSDVAPKGSPCPKCDSSPVYVSRPRSPFETFLVRMQVPICRCHSCYNRYIVFSGLKIHKEMPAGSEAARRPHRRKR